MPHVSFIIFSLQGVLPHGQAESREVHEGTQLGMYVCIQTVHCIHTYLLSTFNYLLNYGECLQLNFSQRSSHAYNVLLVTVIISKKSTSVFSATNCCICVVMLIVWRTGLWETPVHVSSVSMESNFFYMCERFNCICCRSPRATYVYAGVPYALAKLATCYCTYPLFWLLVPGLSSHFCNCFLSYILLLRSALVSSAVKNGYKIL